MRNVMREHATLPIRLILGIGFAFHGYGKLFTEQEHNGFAGMLQGIGVPTPDLTAWLVGGIEFLGGIALIVGAFVGLVATLQIAIMLVALFTVHLGNGFSFMNVTGMTEAGPQFGMPGYEINLLYIAGLSALILSGAGAWSVDRARAARRLAVRAGTAEKSAALVTS